MSEKKFDPSIPRKMYWSDDIPNGSLCPRCGEKLEKEYHAYVIVTREGKDHETFIYAGDEGSFCPNCDTVVLDYEMFATMLSQSQRLSEFAVMGIVDVDAIPEDKENVPLGSDDNPIPLVKFTNASKRSASPKNRRKKKK